MIRALLPATLTERLGIEQAADQLVDLGNGRARPTQAGPGYWVTAASTVGTGLRAFIFGHVRQLDRICGELLARVWAGAPARWRAADRGSGLHHLCGL